MFDGARLKVERANVHIKHLKEAFERFVATDPYTIAIKGQPQGGFEVAVQLTAPVPNEISLIIGDVIHNLRVSLDHATWELIGLDRGTQDRWTKLPASATGKVDYDSSCRGLKTPRDDTKQFFIDLAVYDASPLYSVHVLDNVDKHMIILPIVSAATLHNIEFLTAEGRTAIRMQHSRLIVGKDGLARLASVPSGLTIKTNGEPQISPAIFFAPDQPFATQPVVPTLEALSKKVSVAISTFESFVANRD